MIVRNRYVLPAVLGLCGVAFLTGPSVRAQGGPPPGRGPGEKDMQTIHTLFAAHLGTWVNPWWYAFTAFVGLNLFQSALTNWCPMKWLLETSGTKSA
ncbi:MAG: DUF2892 domain-containing protein [Capsulimonadales bacterium]|nr:DUF2892 domain-containing protein [Capsulimonadales bacterium]